MTPDFPPRSPVRRLDPRVVAQIAAGEMILRPFSVVKELVENAIDAGAESIEITLGETPDTLITGADDGCGMDREDLLTSLEPHATSKLATEDDLFRVGTLGFRGEALPSIGRVARMEILTAPREGNGYRIVVEGGERHTVELSARGRGTSVKVEDLFYNSPVRKRFLKSPEAEVRLVVKLIATTGLAFPGVAFRLRSKGQVLLSLPPAEDTATRIAALHGPAFLEKLLPVESATPRGEIHGFIGIPELARPGTQHQTLIVNRRWVTAPWFSAALRQGYGDLIAPSRNPLAMIFLSLDPARLDVNVHPTKREVRFLDEAALFGDLVRAVRDPLSELVPGWNLDPRDPGSVSRPAIGSQPAASAMRDGSVVRDAETPPAHPSMPGAGGAPELFAPRIDHGGAAPTTIIHRQPAGGPHFAAAATGSAGSIGDPDRPAAERHTEEEIAEGGSSTLTRGGSRGLVPIWQLHQRYLFAQTRQGFLVIDQHAAHERILYERALDHLRGMPAATQQLLFPLPVHLEPDVAGAWGEFAEDLRILGIDAEEFGGRTVLLRGVPANWEHDPAGLFREVLHELTEGRRRGIDRAERVAAAVACRSAVRSGQALSLEESNALVDQLFATSTPHGDPHGRPTFLQVTLADLDRRFGRS